MNLLALDRRRVILFRNNMYVGLTCIDTLYNTPKSEATVGDAAKWSKELHWDKTLRCWQVSRWNPDCELIVSEVADHLEYMGFTIVEVVS